MTVEDLKDKARTLLQFGVETLQQTGTIMQMFTIHAPGDVVEVLGLDSAITNDRHAKEALADAIRSRVVRDRIEAVLMLSDTYTAEGDNRTLEIVRRLGISVVEAGDMGLVTVREAVVVTAENPKAAWTFKQDYKRGEDGKIQLVGNPEELDGGQGGRLSGFFYRSPEVVH